MRVLIVDDDETSCRLLAEVLEGNGFDVAWTTDSITGYEMSLSHPYDLVILDVRMPLLLGTELAQGLKQDCPEAKVILISAFADDSLIRKATSLGASLLSKPFTPGRLLSVVTRVLDEQPQP